MYEKISVQTRWRGDKVSLANGAEVETEVNILHTPIEAELPIWLTGQSDDTFLNTGGLGFNVLAANFSLHHDLKEFVRIAKIYRDAIQTHHDGRGHITLMAHTFVGEFVGENEKAINAIAQSAMDECLNCQHRDAERSFDWIERSENELGETGAFTSQ